MLRRFRNVLNQLSRKARRAAKINKLRVSPKVKLLLEPLEARLVPSATANQVLLGNTLTISEFAAFNIGIEGVGNNEYAIIDSAGEFLFSNVSNIVVNMNVSGGGVEFISAYGTTSGNISINGNGNYNALDVIFGDGWNVNGAVTVKDTGIGSSAVVNLGGDALGSLSVTGGAAVTAPNTFVSVYDLAQDRTFTGTDVDLEDTVVNGSANINLGAGGGEVTSAAFYNGGATGNAVTVEGNLSITDLRTFSADSFYIYNTSVSGNVSLNTSVIDEESANVSFQNDSFSKNLNVTVNVSGSNNEQVYVDNSSITGNASIAELGQADFGYVEVNYSSIGGSLTVVQPIAGSDQFEGFGSVTTFSNTNSNQFYNDASGTPASSIGGAVTIKQSATYDQAFLVSFASIKGAVSVTQTGAEGSFAYIENDPLLKSSVSVNQTALSYNNSIFVTGDQINGSVAVNQASSTYSNYSSNSSGYIFSIYPGTYIDNDTINGSVSINQALGNSSTGGYAYVDIGTALIGGGLTVKQTSGFISELDVYNNSSIGGAVAINQGPDSGYDGVVFQAVSINGAVTVNQNAGAEGHFEIGPNSSFNSSVTIDQYGTLGNFVDLYGQITIVGKLFVGQVGSLDNSVYLEGSYYDYNTSTAVPGIVTVGGLTVQDGAGDNNLQLIDTTIAGPTSINQGVFGIGINTIGFGSDDYVPTSSTVLEGTVTVQQGDGTDYVALGEYEPTTFSSSATFTANASAYALAFDNASGPTRTYSHYTVTS